MDEFELELKQGFLDEAAQSIAGVEQCFLDLENDPNNAENLNKIFRLAHNLKGGSKAVGFDDLGAFTHTFESFILKIKNNQIKASPKVVSLLLRANDHCRFIVESYKTDFSAKIDSTGLMQEMIEFKEDASPVSDTVMVAPTTPTLVPEMAAAEIPEAMPAVAPVEIAPIEVKAKAAVPNSVKTPMEESIRVALPKVENLIDYIGEMVILQNVLKEQMRNIDSVLVKKTLNQLGKVGKEIQDLAMSLRMVPVKPTFQKMQRIVRDTAQALQKDVAIILQGEETELDKTVLERINDPLVHLIRNAVDHGIESTNDRLAKNKPAKGSVTLTAYHAAGRLVIEVRDDGGGLNPEKLKQKAVEKGLIKSDAVLSEKEAFNLIFAPGFSTKELVTDVSGRGVGMDVVKTNILELGGEIQIESVLEKGTTFRIILPLTLAIIDAMVITFGKDRFVLPLNHVYETIQPKSELIHTTSTVGDILVLRGEHLPVIRLGDFFGLRSGLATSQMTALVIRATKEPFVLLVDSIVGQQQVVIKQLGVELSALRGASGITILGDGKPALILEPSEMAKKTITHFSTPKGVAV